MKNILTKGLAIALLLFICMPNAFVASAHSHYVDIEYDDCVNQRNRDGPDEMWYSLISHKVIQARHISETTTVIKYYFIDSSTLINGEKYTWTTDVSEEVANEIKQAYVNSMKMWNNVYYYTYDEAGNRIANKVITVIEGTQTDHNLKIYPYKSSTASAETEPSMNCDDTNSPGYEVTLGYIDGYIPHKHYSEWQMQVDLSIYYLTDNAYEQIMQHNPDTLELNLQQIENNKARIGAHELGHILGLFDVDKCCNAPTSQEHHEELLMGYGDHINRSTHITYKDIAGVSITRGFHTDADHVWMLRENLNDDGSHKSYDVICALCNGVKYSVDNDVTVNGTNYTYLSEEIELFGSCNGEHSINGGNMLLVATDLVRDFYKCLHCRYIEEVDHSTTHIYSHQWAKYDNTYHIEQCGCGVTGTRKALHTVRASEIQVGKAPCIGCGGMIRVNQFDGFTQIIQSAQKVTLNGSYILPDGVIVLVDEDLDAYYNGTLIFYDKNNLPQTQ